MAEEKNRTQQAWGIASGTVLLPFTIRQTRDAAIRDFCNESGYDVPEGMDVWRWLKRRGNSCVKVTLTFRVVEEADPSKPVKMINRDR